LTELNLGDILLGALKASVRDLFDPLFVAGGSVVKRNTWIASAVIGRNSYFAFAATAAGMMLLVTASSDAALKHRYSFTSNANDSKGTAHGVVVDPGTTANFSFVGGQLDLSANAGQGSNSITEDAYVDLPNGIVSSAVTSGTNGAITFEFWATVATQRTWQRFGDFGTSNTGEDLSPGGANSQYVLITPNSGRFMNGLEITNHPASNAAEPNVGLTGPFPVGVEQHVVAVYDHTNTSAGPNGTMTLYHQGNLVGTGAIHPDTNLRTPSDNNNWLGRSQWPDPVFDGSYNEFRIYDTAFTPGMARISFQNGPNGPIVPEPGSLALFAGSIAAGMLAARRRARKGAIVAPV
jgi:hypothetical protein